MKQIKFKNPFFPHSPLSFFFPSSIPFTDTLSPPLAMAMDIPGEQTPLIFSNRENGSSNHPRRNRDSFYSTQRRDSLPSATNTFYDGNETSLDRHDLIPQPQRQRQRQPQPQPQLLHQNLDRAHRQEQAHTITTRHWIVL